MGPDQGGPNVTAEVTVETRGAVGVLTMTRPALTLATKQQLLAGAQRLADDEAVRAIVLTGTGKVFCAGQDLGEHAESLAGADAHALDTVAQHYNPFVLALTQAPKPVVAAVNGTAAGAGLAFAMACDVRVASTAARFTTAFTGIGLTFDSGLSLTLARAIGAARASELVLLNEPFTAQQALEWGMVGRLAEPDDVLPQALALAERLAAGPTLAYAEAKKALHAAAAATLPEVLAGEHVAQLRLGGTEDHRNAVTAFLTKRRPEFRGR